MSQNNNIKILLGITDENIFFSDDCIKEEKRKGIRCMTISATLTYQPSSCACCGVLFDSNIIKHGFLPTNIQLNKSANNLKTILRLRKQRYFCKHCQSAFTLETPLVNKHCVISNPLKLAIFNDATKKRSEVEIAHDHFVSHSTVNRFIHSHYSEKIVRLDSLPKVLCFDEFKSTKDAEGAMSFLFCNAKTGEIIDIIEDRTFNTLRKYFIRFTLEARLSVERIVIDMYAPYMKLIKELFPNAKITLDKFHIVQLISRALNKTRIQIMKHHKEAYNKLKRYWKLLLKAETDLNSTDYYSFKCFKGKMTQKDVVDYLLTIDEELRDSYIFYQNLLFAIHQKKPDLFSHTLHNPPAKISGYLQTSIDSLLKYLPYVLEMMRTTYTNGIIEGINNQIKVIKRIAFGYRSFFHFKARILIIHQYNPIKLERQMKKKQKESVAA